MNEENKDKIYDPDTIKITELLNHHALNIIDKQDKQTMILAKLNADIYRIEHKHNQDFKCINISLVILLSEILIQLFCKLF